VFIGITKLVQSPEKIIPSFVWLELAHQVENFIRGVFTQTVKGSFKVGAFGSDRKESVVGRSLVECGDGANCLIESSPQIVNNVEGMAVEGSWHRFSELELKEIMSAVSVKLADNAVVVGLEKSLSFPFKFGYVIVSPVDTKL
jgi:hypothetical protein